MKTSDWQRSGGGWRGVTTKINSTRGKEEEAGMGILSAISRNESRRERVVFPWKIQNRGVALFLTNRERERERGRNATYTWNIVSVYGITAAIYGGALTSSPPGDSTNVVNRYWYWRGIVARRRRFPRLYRGSGWPNASGLLYHGQTIAILCGARRMLKWILKCARLEGRERHGVSNRWEIFPRLVHVSDYRGLGQERGRKGKFGNEFLIVPR